MVVAQKPKQSPSVSPLKVKRSRQPKNVKVYGRKTHMANPQKQAVSENPEKHLRRKKATIDSVYDISEARSSALERAKEVQTNLDPGFPCLIKCMLPSHVTRGFWLGLPKKFCDLHLPKTDKIIDLEDESGKKYETKYLAEKVGFSAGWRGFSLAHNLLEGDVLVFHLVQPSKFKVYIIRSTGSDEVDGALGLLKLDGCLKQMDYDVTQENGPKSSLMTCDAIVPQLDASENTSEDFDSEVLDGIRLSESVISFKEVTGIQNFSILVNGLVITSQLTEYLRTKYYELCCSQKSFLHDHLLEGLNSKLVAGIISETINIADAIRASKTTTPPDSFAIWDKTLKAFEMMGMNVSFLIARLEKLMNLALTSKRYMEARLERDRAVEEIKTLEAKLMEVKKTINRLDDEIDTQDMNSERLETMFQELAKTPW